MTGTFTVRHRTRDNLPTLPFSARNFRDLSGAPAVAALPPEGFADTRLPVSGETLAQAIYLSGLLAPPALCSGIGRCGLCRVRFIADPPPAQEAEATVLSRHDLDAGWRLACRHKPVPGMHVLAPAPLRAAAAARPSPERRGRYGLAVDFGTTSLHWRLVPLDRPDNADLPHGVMTNPQMGAGSDVISRLAYAERPDGAAVLRRLAVDALAEVIRSCAVAGFRTTAACVAGNPAMTALLMGRDAASLARAPYSLPLEGNTEERLPGLPPVYIPPQISPFVGGDVSAGYAALALDPAREPPEYPFLLADMGTNGECVLALSPERTLAASLPMGPALEGVNLTFGSEAVPGAVTDFSLTPYGLEAVVMGGGSPTGIAATGYLALLRILRASNVLDEDGLFTDYGGGALAGKMGASRAAVEERRIRLPGRLALYAADVEEILKVKASFTLSVSRLLREAALPATKLACMYLAGSLGGNVSLAALSSLGFLPPGTGGKVRLAGNTSLAGALLLLRDRSIRDACARWARSVTTLDLAADPAFARDFARHMTFSWKP